MLLVLFVVLTQRKTSKVFVTYKFGRFYVEYVKVPAADCDILKLQPQTTIVASFSLASCSVFDLFVSSCLYFLFIAK